MAQLFAQHPMKRPPIYVWVLDSCYNDRIVAASERGLRERIEASLRASGAFRHNPRPKILGFEADLEGHIEQAMKRRYLLDLSALGAWQLFAKRARVAPSDNMLPFVDIVTLAAFDTACAHFLRHTILREDALLRDQWPGCSEWFVEAGSEPEPGVLPCMHGVVVRYLRRQLSDMFVLPERSYEVHTLDPEGLPLSTVEPGYSHGTFLVRVVPPVSHYLGEDGRA